MMPRKHLIPFLAIFSLTASTTLAGATRIFIDSSKKGGKQNPIALRYGRQITGATLRSRLAVLTADSLEGRETGTIGAWKAQHYIAAQFKSIGLKPAVGGSYFFDVPLIRTAFVSAQLTSLAGKPKLKGFTFFPNQRAGRGSGQREKLVILRLPASADSLQLALTKVDLAGKALIVLSAEKPLTGDSINLKTWSRDHVARLRMVIRKQPALILWVDNFQVFLAEHPSELKKLYQTSGVALHEDTPPVLKNEVFLSSTEGIDLLLKQGGSSLAQITTLVRDKFTDSLDFHVAVQLHFKEELVKAADVLGLVSGTDLKQEVLVISAHYDHLGMQRGRIYHGADDDGSGTSALLSLASSFSEAAKAGHRPRRTILFLSNVGEEKGLLGSEYYSEHPVFPPAQTITDLNIDMIGRIDSAHFQDSNYVYVIGSGKLSSGLQQLSEQVNATYSQLKLDYRFDDPADPNRFYYRSDHYNFAKLGIPIIFYFNGVHADYHEPTDVIEKINFGIYQKRARLVFYTAWELANRSARPLVDRTSDFK